MVAARGGSKKSNLPYSGFLLTFEPRRTEKIDDQLRLVGTAAQSFSALDWSLNEREVALLALVPGMPNISGAVLMERMQGSGGTGTLKMRLSDAVLFGEAIDAESLRAVLVLSDNVSTAERMKRIDPDVWPGLLQAIKDLKPESADALDRLLARRTEERRLLGQDIRIRRLIEQRDAIGISLDIGNQDRKGILRSMDASRIDTAQSALDLLDTEPLQEQDLIRHDAAIFKDLLEEGMRHAQFTATSGRAVRVYVYDKKPLETVLGIDLLIYQQVYRSFLLIQYKTMDQMPGKLGRTWSYLVDEQFSKQINAMNAAAAAIAREPAERGDIWDWRLHSSPFYFKFCETTRPNARDDSLVAGLTLGVDPLEHFLTLPEAEHATHGGRRVGYDNCPRYLTNTQFVELAREGWIGCDRKGFGVISGLLRANQQGGKLTMLTMIEGTTPTDAYRRGWRSKSR